MLDGALLIATIGHIISSIILGGSGILVLLQKPNRTLNRAFFVAAISAGIFGLSLAIGMNLRPSPLAYVVWMVNIIDVALIAAYLHFIFAALKIDSKNKLFIQLVYVVGAVITVAAILFPRLFIPEVTPKLFTLSYLNAGPLYHLMFWYFIVVFFVAFIVLVRAYLRETKDENKRRIEYFLFATIIGFGIAPADFLLVFDIPVSPLYGMFFGLYMVPIAYGILADQLLDIRVVIQRALLYAVGIAAVAGSLTILILLNDILVAQVPWVRFWMIPILTATISFVIGRLFWLKLVENDHIKYEFITVATHKLRTPLTQISWGVRSLVDLTPDREAREVIERIQQANSRLIELTNLLFATTEEDSQEQGYHKKEYLAVQKTKNILKRLQTSIAAKGIEVSLDAKEEISTLADDRRLSSVIEVFLENAVSYTPEKGSITITIKKKGPFLFYSVRDSGIGIGQSEKNLIFTRFYRTDAARKMDTEGVGLGLAMSKNIIKKHKGKIGVESEGEGKGSTFWFTIPLW